MMSFLTISTNLLFVGLFRTLEIEIYKIANTFTPIMIKHYSPKTTTQSISLFSFIL